MEQDALIVGIVPLIHDDHFKQSRRDPELPERAAVGGTAPTVGFESFSNGGDATAPQTVVKGTGPFMSIVNINLVFWGRE
jgi:hypothetical protein